MESIFFSLGVPQQSGEEVIAAITRRMKETINANAPNPKRKTRKKKKRKKIESKEDRIKKCGAEKKNHHPGIHNGCVTRSVKAKPAERKATTMSCV